MGKHRMDAVAQQQQSEREADVMLARLPAHVTPAESMRRVSDLAWALRMAEAKRWLRWQTSDAGASGYVPAR